MDEKRERLERLRVLERLRTLQRDSRLLALATDGHVLRKREEAAVRAGRRHDMVVGLDMARHGGALFDPELHHFHLGAIAASRQQLDEAHRMRSEAGRAHAASMRRLLQAEKDLHVAAEAANEAGLRHRLELEKSESDEAQDLQMFNRRRNHAQGRN